MTMSKFTSHEPQQIEIFTRKKKTLQKISYINVHFKTIMRIIILNKFFNKPGKRCLLILHHNQKAKVSISMADAYDASIAINPFIR